jgi:hypothetical protein
MLECYVYVYRTVDRRFVMCSLKIYGLSRLLILAHRFGCLRHPDELEEVIGQYRVDM